MGTLVISSHEDAIAAVPHVLGLGLPPVWLTLGVCSNQAASAVA
jgi:hypothetical protein